MACSGSRPIQVWLLGSDDPALVATLAEVLVDLDAVLVSERERVGDADLVLLWIADRDEVAPWLGLYAARARGLPVVALLPFHDERLAAQTGACGALACHGLDQPIARLAQVLRATGLFPPR
jgi:hypothetical protein